MSGRAAAIALAFSLWLAGVSAQASEDPSVPIFERAEAAQQAGDKAGLDKARDEVDALLAASPASPLAHYTRGWILARISREADAVVEYDEALRLNPKLSDAAYNAGVVLMELGRESEAIARFEAAVVIDPRFTDAFYNLGQARYNRGQYAEALVAWQRARELMPADFQTAKKIVQAFNGMGDREGASRARMQAIEIWRNSTDPGVRNLKEFVFDQFEAAGWHVFASEVFEHPEDAGYLYRFQVANAEGDVIGSVRLEPGYGLKGAAYLIGMSKGTAMWTPGPGFESLPDYDTLKPLVISAIAKEFPRP